MYCDFATDEHPKSVVFPSQAVDARNICLSGLPATSILELLLYAVSFSVLFPLLYFGNEAYNNYLLKKQKPPSMPCLLIFIVVLNILIVDFVLRFFFSCFQ